MVTLLSKLFIHGKGLSPEQERRRYGLLCGGVGIGINLLLFAAKLVAGLLSGSIAITADALNNLSDAGSSILSILGFYLASGKADRDHPFGHGRYEYISGFVISIIIVVMAFELGMASVENIITPKPVEAGVLTICILVFSVLAKIYMFYYNRKIGRKINSSAMEATALDSLSDVLSTSAVLVSIILSFFFSLNLDGYFGLLVAIVILRTGIMAAKDTISPLLGRPPDPALCRDITDFVMSYDGIVGVHDLIVHDYGPGRVMITLHAEVPSSGDIIALHDTIDTIERQLMENFHCHAVIHMDPLDTDDALTQQLNISVAKGLRGIDPGLSHHDLRLVSGPTHSNIIFDVVVPHGFKMPEAALLAQIDAMVAAIDATYFAAVTIDKPFI